jgi:hypothetical protein
MMSAPFKIEENKIKMLPKDESSDSQDNYIDFDSHGRPRNTSSESYDRRNQNKIRSVNNLRYTHDTLTEETLAEESGIGLTKKEREHYI